MRTILTIALTAILAGAAAFYGGVKYSGGGGGVAVGNGTMTGSVQASGTAGFRGGGVGGEVIASDGKSITVKTADGSTSIVYLASTTRVTSSSEGTLTDLAKGATVVAAGTASTEESGAVTARSVQIVPAGSDLASFGGMRGAPAGTPAAPQQ